MVGVSLNPLVYSIPLGGLNRLFHALSRSAKYVLSLVVTADFKAVACKDGVRILDIGRAVGTLRRVSGSVKYLYALYIPTAISLTGRLFSGPRPRSSIEH